MYLRCALLVISAVLPVRPLTGSWISRPDAVDSAGLSEMFLFEHTE